MSHHPHASIDRESSPQVEIEDEWLCEPTEVFIVQRCPGEDDDTEDYTEPELPLDDNDDISPRRAVAPLPAPT
jgi:hypothetical protein